MGPLLFLLLCAFAGVRRASPQKNYLQADIEHRHLFAALSASDGASTHRAYRHVVDATSNVFNSIKGGDDVVDKLDLVDTLATVLTASKVLSAGCKSDMAWMGESLLNFGLAYRENCTNANKTAEAICEADREETLVANEWTLNVLDVFGKPAQDLLKGNFYWLGSFRGCKHIRFSAPADSKKKANYIGQYCVGTAPLNLLSFLGLTGNGTTYLSNQTRHNKEEQQQLQDIMTRSSSTIAPIQIGMCFPDTCGPEDIMRLLDLGTDLLNKKLKKNIKQPVDSIVCHNPLRLEKDGGAIGTIVFCAIWLAILMCGTAYDYFVFRGGAPRKSSSCGKGADLFYDRKEYLKQKYKSLRTSEKVLLSFSIVTNSEKVLDTTPSSNTIGCIHGIRFLSMCWVILGHTYYFALNYFDNKGYIADVLKEFLMPTISNATVSVDSFFVMSGFLLAYLWLKETRKRNGRNLTDWSHWLLYFLHRYLRLTPVYAVILLLNVKLFRYLADGPLWDQGGVEINNCSGTWWINLLYVNNFWGFSEVCMGHTWYLAIDMQLHYFAPLLLIPLYFSAMAGFAIAFGLIAINVGLLAWFVVSRNWPPNSIWTMNTHFTPVDYSYLFDVYFKPYMRWSPYVIGVLLGYILYRLGNRKIRIPAALKYLLRFLTIGMNVLLVYGLYNYVKGDYMPPTLNGFYSGLNRTIWAVNLAYLMFECITGNGGIIDRFLSFPGWLPFSRLTYCAYLIHPYVMRLTYEGRDRAVHFDTHYTMVYFFVGHLSVAYAAAYVLSVSFESPIMGLEKILFEPFSRRPTPEDRRPITEDPSAVSDSTTVVEERSHADDNSNADSGITRVTEDPSVNEQPESERQRF